MAGLGSVPLPGPAYIFLTGDAKKGESPMLTIDQAKAALNEVIENIQVKHADYMLLANSLELLYDGAKENQESRQAMKDPN
jgi:hypothetical protein